MPSYIAVFLLSIYSQHLNHSLKTRPTAGMNTLREAYATDSQPSPCLGHLMHSCMPIWAYVFHYICPVGRLCSQQIERGIRVCICVCSCMCQDRYSCAYTNTCRHMQIHMCPYRPTLLVTFTSVYIHAYPAMQSTYTQVCCNKPIVFLLS